MQWLKRITITFFIIIALLLWVGLILPGEFKVERRIQIAAPQHQIYAYLVDLNHWHLWEPWTDRDPNMQISTSSPSIGVGAYRNWKSQIDGNGSLKMTQAISPRLIEYESIFEGWDSPQLGHFELRSDGETTTVIWSFSGELGSNPLFHYFALMMNSMVGPDLEEGLAKLKLVSKSPTPTHSQ